MQSDNHTIVIKADNTPAGQHAKHLMRQQLTKSLLSLWVEI
jgi:hypothetical protein